MNRKLLALALACTALAVGACGDDDDADTADTPPAPTTETTPPAETTTQEEPGAGGGQTLEADADPSGQLRFTVDSLEAEPGTVTITMDNPSDLPHAVAIKGGGVDEQGETVQEGGTSEVTAELEAGEYEFYCPVPGHEEGGMEGTLTVE